MHGYPDPLTVVNRLRQLPLDQARAELSTILDAPWGLGYGQQFAKGLDYNARLVTLLRDRGVKIWGTEPPVVEP